MPQPEQPAARGTIYDIGYQRYQGPRLGRAYAVWSLYLASLRTAFGIGRGAWTKVFVFGLITLTFIPALLQVAIAAILPGDFEVYTAEAYYGYVQLLLILFAALVASDLVGNDKRHRVLPLYFSRPLVRDDYALAKIAALSTALLAMTIAPQTLLFFGNWMGAGDTSGYLGDNADQILPILVSGALLCILLGTIGIAIAAYAERRAFVMPSIVGLFLVTLFMALIVSDIGQQAARIAVPLSPFHVARGFTLFLFDVTPQLPAFTDGGGGPANNLAIADLPEITYLGLALLYSAIAAAFTVWHYRGLR